MKAVNLLHILPVLTLLVLASPAMAVDPIIEPLWPEGAPGALGEEDKDIPQLVTYLPAEGTANGAAIVICPGGGYGGLAWSYEGADVAQWFNTHGMTAAVLDYRHRGKGYGHPAPMQDAQRALRLMRSRAEEWGLDRERVGIMGFSAGGHLAATASTQFDVGDENAADFIDRESCRPDFCILAYPVITLTDPHTHVGSRVNLLGQDATAEEISAMSCENNVTAETPPTFLFHTSEDNGVPAENSIMYYSALRQAGVPAELHVFEPGHHGVGMALDHPSLHVWRDLAANWLEIRGVIPEEPQVDGE